MEKDYTEPQLWACFLLPRPHYLSQTRSQSKIVVLLCVDAMPFKEGGCS